MRRTDKVVSTTDRVNVIIDRVVRTTDSVNVCKRQSSAYRRQSTDKVEHTTDRVLCITYIVNVITDRVMRTTDRVPTNYYLQPTELCVQLTA